MNFNIFEMIGYLLSEDSNGLFGTAYFVNVFLLGVMPFVTIMLFRKHGWSTGYHYITFPINFYTLTTLPDLYKYRNGLYSNFMHEHEMFANKADYEIYLAYDMLFLCLYLSIFFGFYYKSKVSRFVNRTVISTIRSIKQKQDDKKQKLENERLMEEGRAREASNLQIQLEIERERTKQAQIKADAKQKQMEHERPAKVSAVDDLLDKLDDI